MRPKIEIALLLLAAPATAQEIAPDPSTYGLLPTCLDSIRDQATENCVRASTVPTQGMLYPLGPGFFFDGSGHLQVPGLGAGGNVLSSTGLGLGTSSPISDLHIKRNGSLEVLLEADANGSSLFDQPRIRFSLLGAVVQSFVGYQDGTTHLSLRNLDSVGGMKFDLHTSSTNSWEFRRRASVATDVEGRLHFNGNLELDGGVSSPAADLAEYYPVVGPVEPGDVVAFTGQGLSLERARAGTTERLAGVVSSRPAFTMGLSYTVEGEPGIEPPRVAQPATARAAAEPVVDPAVLHEIEVNGRAPLALSGRIPCKVTAENGPIEPGDPLTASAVPGHATKAVDPGAVIGTALEAWHAGEGTILVLANLGWYSPQQRVERELARLQAEVERLERLVVER